MGFPFDGADVFVWSAIAIVAVLGADAVAVLRDFPSDPVGLRKGADDVAHELRFADAAGVPANHDDPPTRSFVHVTSLPVWLPTL